MQFVIHIDPSEDLCYDEWSGRYFSGSKSKIEVAVSKANYMLIEGGELSLNDFYALLNLSPIQMGEEFGWYLSAGGNKRLGANIGATLTSEGRPAVTMWFTESPKHYSTRML